MKQKVGEVVWIVKNPYTICILMERIGNVDRQFKGKAKCNTFVPWTMNYLNSDKEPSQTVDATPEKRDKFDEEKGKRIAYLRAITKVHNATVKSLSKSIKFKKGTLAIVQDHIDAHIEEQSAIVAQIHSDNEELLKIIQ